MSLLHSELKALVLDLDGTLFLGEAVVPGFMEFFEFLQINNLPFVVASNNATKSPADYARKFRKQGVKVGEDAILTAGIATVEYLVKVYGKKACLYVIGEQALTGPLIEAGFSLQKDSSRPVEAVIVGGDSGLNYEKLKNAALLLQKGADLVGTNPDVLYPCEEGLVPEAGTTLAALQAATGVVPQIVGKPHRYLFDLAVTRLGVKASRTAVLGDRLETDILGGKRAGLRTILTTTGVDNEITMGQKDIYPDWIVSGLEELIELWSM